MIEKINAVREALNGRSRAVISIDGRCASGKTTFAAALSAALGAEVIHADDFFLPPELRTPERLAEAGGNFHRERFTEEVISRIPGGKPFDYGVFDCKKLKIGRAAHIGNSGIIVIEGAYCLHPGMPNISNLKIFFSVGREEQLRRIALRNGKEALKSFSEKWIPFEERYFEAFSIIEKCDMIFE